MFVWTTGMNPGIGLVLFLVGLVFVLYNFAHAFHWTGGWDQEDDAMSPRPPERGAKRTNVAFRPWECPNGKCRAGNPSHARFCRMCGKPRQA